MNSSGISLNLCGQEPSPQAGETAHGSMLGPAGHAHTGSGAP